MGDDDLDAEPFGKDEGEDLITEGMVKKGTYLIHKLAERRGADFKEIQKKCRKLLEYDNLAKVPISKGHAIIDKLIALTGGDSDTSEKEELETELGKLAEMLQICVGFSRDIVQEEIGKENISEGTQAMLVKSFAATLYIDASKRGLGR
jgi:hypothetical protein